jgi:hypothetical protein
MRNYNFYFLLALIIGTQIIAAPHPGMGSSLLNQPQSSAVFSQMGFKLTTIPAGWNFIESHIAATNSLESAKDLQLEIGKSFSVGTSHMGRISFKFENGAKKVDLESYVKKYLRDYNQYGFDVSGLQSLREKNSVIVDINQKNKKTRSRQMFFQNGTRIVMATCTDEFENFAKTIAECNQIFSGLSWR